jgi:hypothetical protein
MLTNVRRNNSIKSECKHKMLPFIARCLGLVQFEMACILCLYDETYLDMRLEVSNLKRPFNRAPSLQNTAPKIESRWGSPPTYLSHVEEVLLSDLR